MTYGPARYRGGPPFRGPRLFLPILIGAIQVIGTHFAAHDQTGVTRLDALGYLLLVAGPLALTTRRRHPVGVLFFVLGVTLGYVLLDYPVGPVFLSLIVAFATAVMKGHRTAAIAALVIGYPAFLWLPHAIDVAPPPTLSEALGLAAWLLVIFTFSEMARTRREAMKEYTRRRAEQQKQRADEERLRIARELHDVLAHNISLINVQAGVALHLMEERPEQARTALTAIKEASGEALGELRSVLDILRDGHEGVPRTPTSGLADLDHLIAKTEATGLRVTKKIEGSARALPAGVDLAAFRIVQEALTNVTRHGNATHAKISIAYGERELIVHVDNDGPVAAPAEPGKGISGMRERATALDGDLEAGPKPTGGFRVRARLPLDGDERS